MTIYSVNDDGEIIILFDSRWRYPETLGYKPGDPQYKLLRRLWEEATGETETEREAGDAKTEVHSPSD